MSVSPEQLIARDRNLSLQQKVLLIHDGTLTQLLEVLVGEPVRVRKLGHRIVAQGPRVLDAGRDQAILKRCVLLCGAVDVYVYAESHFVLERLPASVREGLDSGAAPIGRLWQEAKLETYRELLDFRREPAGSLGRHFDVGTDAELLSRTYLVRHGGRAFGVITEKFPATHFP